MMEKVVLQIPPEWGMSALDFSWLAVWDEIEMATFGVVHWSMQPKPHPEPNPRPNPTEPSPTEPVPTKPTPTEPVPTEPLPTAAERIQDLRERQSSKKTDYAGLAPLLDSPFVDWLEENKVAAGSSAAILILLVFAIV